MQGNCAALSKQGTRRYEARQMIKQINTFFNLQADKFGLGVKNQIRADSQEQTDELGRWSNFKACQAGLSIIIGIGMIYVRTFMI